jgi:hypothetical protein
MLAPPYNPLYYSPHCRHCALDGLTVSEVAISRVRFARVNCIARHTRAPRARATAHCRRLGSANAHLQPSGAHLGERGSRPPLLYGQHCGEPPHRARSSEGDGIGHTGCACRVLPLPFRRRLRARTSRRVRARQLSCPRLGQIDTQHRGNAPTPAAHCDASHPPCYLISR